MTSRRHLMRVLAAGVVASGLCTALPGCGYSLGAGSGLAQVAPGRAVRAGPFDNGSFEADAALLAQRAVSRELGVRGAGAGAGDAVLVGRVDEVRFVPVGVVGTQDVRLWRADVRLSLTLHEGAPDGRRIASAVVTGSEDYRGLNDVEGTEVSRRLALSRLLERLAAEGLDRLAP